MMIKRSIQKEEMERDGGYVRRWLQQHTIPPLPVVFASVTTLCYLDGRFFALVNRIIEPEGEQ